MDSPIPYFGGKSRLAATIIGRIPKHKTYAEVFGGAAWILFRKPLSALETLNDLDKNLMNFWRVTKFHTEALAEELAGLQHGRDLFYMFREERDRPLLTDIQRAAIYYYLQRHAFAGSTGWPSLATRPGRPVQCRAAVYRRVLPLVAERLKDVMLENLTWDRFVGLYDAPETFFFLDPPYIGHRAYLHNFKADDFTSLAAALRAIKGRFPLTHADQPEIRELFRWRGVKIQEVELPYTVQQLTPGQSRRIGHEVLISNY